MNSANAMDDPKAALIDTNQKSQNAARLFWGLALIGPIPFVLAAILADLSKIESLPVYVWSLSAWAAALLAYAALVRSRWNRTWLFPRTRISHTLMTAGIACQVCALGWQSLPTAVNGWILLNGAWLSTHSGKHDSGPWKLLNHWPALFVLMQLPHFAVELLYRMYQQVLSQTAAVSLDLLSVPFFRTQSQFDFARFAMSVDDVLVHSPFIVWMLLVSCIIFSWRLRPFILLPAYLAAGILWAFGIHLLQFCMIVVVRHVHGVDVGSGWLLVLLSVSTLVAAIGQLWSTDRCLRILFVPVPLEDSAGDGLNPISRLWNRMFLPLAADS